MSQLLSPTFLIGEFRIGQVSEASCVNLGNNLPVDFQSNKKVNQGFGSITGDNNQIEKIRNLLSDPDVLDMFNQSEMEDLPEWIKQIMESELNQSPDIS